MIIVDRSPVVLNEMSLRFLFLFDIKQILYHWILSSVPINYWIVVGWYDIGYYKFGKVDYNNVQIKFFVKNSRGAKVLLTLSHLFYFSIILFELSEKNLLTGLVLKLNVADIVISVQDEFHCCVEREEKVAILRLNWTERDGSSMQSSGS